MKFINTEHLTRYTVTKEGIDYIRLVEKPVNGEQTVTWMITAEGMVYLVEEDQETKLEEEFLLLLA